MKTFSLIVLVLFLLISVNRTESISSDSQIVARFSMKSGQDQLWVETTDLEVASIVQLIRRVHTAEALLGGKVTLDQASEYGFYFDPTSIMIYHPVTPELRTAMVVSPYYDEWPSTIQGIRGNLARYVDKIAYIKIDEITDYQEYVRIIRDKRWLEASPVVTTSAKETQPSLIQDSKGVYWIAYTVGAGTRQAQIFGAQVFITKSSDGESWSEPISIASSPGEQSVPSLFQDHDGAYWIAYREGSMIMLTTSGDGSHWSTPAALTEGHHPSLCQDSRGTYWIAYTNEAEGGIALLQKAEDGSWSRPINIENTGLPSWNPSFLQSRDGIYWIAFASLVPGTETLEQGGTEVTEPEMPPIGIFLRRTSDLTTWSPPMMVADGTDEFHLFQDSKGQFWLAFQSARDGNLNIFLMNSRDGKTWSDPERVTDDPANDIEASMIRDRGGYSMALTSWRNGDYDIFITMKPDQVTATVTGVTATVTGVTASATGTTTLTPGYEVPGFPIESILAGLMVGAIALTIIRRRRNTQA